MEARIVIDINLAEEISIEPDKLYIRVNSYEGLLFFLTSAEVREKQIQELKDLITNLSSFDEENPELDPYYDEIMEEVRPLWENIKYIEALNNNPIKIGDSEEVYISFGDNSGDISTYKELFESIEGNLVVNANKLSLEDLKIISSFNLKSKPLIKHDYNSIEDVELNEFIETLEIIEEIKGKILKYNFSVLEQLLFLYDLLKDRVYKMSEADKSHSRDLSKVLKEEEIVCAGYANIFAAVANSLGIPCYNKIYLSTNRKGIGHATNTCFINDEKYGFKGIIEFDVTSDSKRSVDDNVVNNYRYFALTESYANKAMNAAHYAPLQSRHVLAPLIKKNDTYNNICETKAPDIFIRDVLKSLIKIIKPFYELIYNPAKISLIEIYEEEIKAGAIIAKDDINNLIEGIYELFDARLSFDIFLKALYNVRRVQHSLNPTKYPLSKDELTKIAQKKYTRERLVFEVVIKNQTLPEIIQSSEVLQKIDDDIIDKVGYDANRMKLLYYLRQKQEKVVLPLPSK